MYRMSLPGRLAAVGLVAVSSVVNAAPVSFDFKDPKSVNSMTFVLDSMLEPIMGVAAGVSGTVSYDPASPRNTTGKITVDARTLYTPNTGMTKTLHGGDWLNIEKNPTIEFTIKNITSAMLVGEEAYDLDVTGDFTCNGVTRELSFPVRAVYLPGRLGDRIRDKKGDLLVLRANFTIRRSEFNIKPGANDVVADEIEIRASIVGCAFKP